jgi:hypothetical protein
MGCIRHLSLAATATLLASGVHTANARNEGLQ